MSSQSPVTEVWEVRGLNTAHNKRAPCVVINTTGIIGINNLNHFFFKGKKEYSVVFIFFFFCTIDGVPNAAFNIIIQINCSACYEKTACP